jgi:hypothetical protein
MRRLLALFLVGCAAAPTDHAGETPIEHALHSTPAAGTDSWAYLRWGIGVSLVVLSFVLLRYGPALWKKKG